MAWNEPPENKGQDPWGNRGREKVRLIWMTSSVRCRRALAGYSARNRQAPKMKERVSFFLADCSRSPGPVVAGRHHLPG